MLKVQPLLRRCGVHTVCESARCPNIGECFSQGTVTFMILGDVCTRNCTFCAVSKGKLPPLDPEEPKRVAQAARELESEYVVVTSVTRDDLPDGGASQFVATIRALHELLPEGRVEVLVPDFQGDEQAIRSVAEAGPDVYGHNVETVPRLYPEVRPRADYLRSLDLLRKVKSWFPYLLTKSGLMVGLGETQQEVWQVMSDLWEAGTDLLTIGQYLRPTGDHHPVFEYVSPEVFEKYRQQALELGFRGVASAPLVRSSYHAEEMAQQLLTAAAMSREADSIDYA